MTHPTPSGLGNLMLGFRTWLRVGFTAWDRFWFSPRYPHVLGLLRICTGLMLLYSHLLLATELSSFLGEDAWINNTTAMQLHDGAFGVSDMGRSYLWHVSNPLLLWLHHALTLLVTGAFAAGLLTRITAPAAWFLQLMYLHRLTGTLFGLDQIITYLTMYLALTPSGSCFSVDAWLRHRLAGKCLTHRKLDWLFPEAVPSLAANLGTRLFQIHLCVIYFFGGLAKARGELWWDGTATWFAAANYEYQSMDMTWISRYPWLFSALTHITLFWEIMYFALVWPRLTRPIVLALAVAVHGGIAICLGMVTFGTMMIAANVIFVEPKWLLPKSDERGPDASGSRDSKPVDARFLAREQDRREQQIEAEKEKLQIREAKLRERVGKLKKRERKVRRAVEKLRPDEIGDEGLNEDD
ncbi:HTTM domain-containing protein [Novipirellula artificiosorum]|uniref:HTTM-like domain-containing protein n=1 Tax=Novipirellula artificiosorum TaxID=2528016 RepID=A0A5C6E0H2_9BACT|nr:HTTM domain-containing protein [Novipirellula artificiosorum]TWU41994.1 hypothetical protein Poly41_02900 [Novipirellula artificiosorum]